MSKRRYARSESEYREAVASSFSLAETARKLGLLPAGGNYETIKRKVDEFDLSIEHFTGQGWKKGQFFNTHRDTTSIKKRLVRERGHTCQKCLNSEWLNQPIALELEHIDGNHGNHTETNLLLLCPNCHAQTATYRRAKSSFFIGPQNAPSKQQLTGTCSCGNRMSSSAKSCLACYDKTKTKIAWPPLKSLVDRVAASSFSTVSKELGVSDTAIRRFLAKNGVDPKLVVTSKRKRA